MKLLSGVAIAAALFAVPMSKVDSCSFAQSGQEIVQTTNVAFEQDFNTKVVALSNEDLAENYDLYLEDHYEIDDQGVLTGLSEEGKEILNEKTDIRVYIPEGVIEVTGKINADARGVYDSLFGHYNGYTSTVQGKTFAITLPSTLKKIGEAAFGRCAMERLEIPDGVTEIGEKAFSEADMTEIKLPRSLTTIGEYAFNNNNFTHIEIPYGVTTIGEYAFGSCRDLVSIDLPESLETIESAVFNYCSNLKGLKIPKSVMSIDANIFEYSGAKWIELPNGLESESIIGDYSFFWSATVIAGSKERAEEYKTDSRWNLTSAASRITYAKDIKLELTTDEGEETVYLDRWLDGENFKDWHWIDGNWEENADYTAATPELPEGYAWEDAEGNPLTEEEVLEKIEEAQSQGENLTIVGKKIATVNPTEPTDDTDDDTNVAAIVGGTVGGTVGGVAGAAAVGGGLWWLFAKKKKKKKEDEDK